MGEGGMLEMAQWLRARATLAKDLGLVPSIPMVTHFPL